MGNYKKKPVVIEAYQFPNEYETMPKPFIAAISKETIGPTAEGGIRYYIETLEGEMEVSYGDYVIKGVKGEFYSCRCDIFDLTYEKVDDNVKS